MLSELARRTRPLILAGSTVGGLLVLAAPAHAQRRACGDTVVAAQSLADDFAQFMDPRLWPPPGDGNGPLSPSDVHRVATDPRECRRVLHAARHHLPPQGRWAKHWVYRFGPYYAIEIMERLPRGVSTTGGDGLYVFRASDMKYVTVIVGI